MDNNLKSIFETFDSISESKKQVNKLNEVSKFSGDLFGGKSVKIPVDGAHGGQSGWPSRDAWDIPAGIGTEVYAITSGQVITFSDYGPSIKKTQGKKLYGIGFTVKSDDGLPDVYYTHLKNVKVKKGDKIECGQLLGQVMDMPNSSYDHVHIGVSNKVNIRKLIGTGGKIKCSKPGTMKKVDVSQEIMDLIFGKKSSDSILSKIGSTLTSMLNLKEQIIDVKRYAKTNGWSGYDDLTDEITKELASNFNKYIYHIEQKDKEKKCDGKIKLINSTNNKITFQVDHSSGCDTSFFPKTFYGLSINQSGNRFTVTATGKIIDAAQSSNFDPDEGNVEIPDWVNDLPITKNVEKIYAAQKVTQNLKEESVFGNFGNKTKSSGMSEIIPKEKNQKILSPIKGFINNTKAAHGCKNSITIETSIDDEKYFLQYCNISEPKVRDGQSVSKGTLLGSTKDDVEVTMYNGMFEKQRIQSFKNKEISKKEEKVKSSPVPVFGKKKQNKPVEKKVKKDKKVKQDYDNEFNDKKKPSYEYPNPLIGAAVDLALAPFTNKWTWPTEKKQPKPDSFFKSKKLKEETERIKKLLK
jgi:murein DD-endopeptidase MepM/ murein hydrolase activator NlpD